MTEEKTKITAWVYKSQLEKLRKSLGVDDSKVVRACMNCADNVIHRLFGGEVQNIFKRRKPD